MRYSLRTLLPLVVTLFLLLTMLGAYGVAEEGRRQQAFRDAGLAAQKDAFHLLQELGRATPNQINDTIMLLATDARMSRLVVANSHGQVAYTSEPRLLGRALDTIDDLPPTLLPQAAQHSLAVLQPDYDKLHLHLAVAVPAEDDNVLRSKRHGMLVITYDLASQLAVERSKLRNSFVLPGLMLLALLLVLYLLVWLYVARPLANLQAAALQLARDGRAQLLPVQGVSETRAVCEAFNTMQQQLQQMLAELGERERRASRLAMEQEALLQASPDLLFELSADGRYLQVWSHTASDKLVSPRDVLLGKQLRDVMPATQAQVVEQVVADALQHGESFGRQIMLALPDGVHWFELSAARKLSPGGNESCIIVSRDITQRQRDSEALSLWAKVMAAAHNGILITDGQQRIIEVNAAFTRITGYTLDEVRGLRPSVLSSGRHDAAFYQRIWQEIEANGHWQGEIWNRRKDGVIFPEWQSISCVRGDDGQISHYISVFSDISSQKESEEYIRRLAYYDNLTGLANRALLGDHAAQALTMLRAHHTTLALMFIDLDRFKNINDTLGHSVGDLLLQQVGRRLASLVRERDTLSRLGGDEFIVLLPETGEAEAAHWAEQVLAELSRPYQIAGYDMVVTPSIGIAMAPTDGDTLEVLLRSADAAMYRAKDEGRNGFRFFASHMQQRTVNRLRLEADLRRAISDGELLLHYQPQCTLDGQLVGVEALVRWQHPALGMIAPGEFIPLAEESGLVVPLGSWVMREAVGQLAAWRAAGVPVPQVAVNLSALQFRQPQLVQQVQDCLQQAGVPPACLELELTESVVLNDPDEALALMERLHALGVRLSIDDFGTGYSSLNYLRRFPIDRLKIDRSFILDLDNDPRGAAIVEAIVSLSRSLGFVTIAEGVETAHQLAQLRRLHCDEVQGYYYARPMPAAQLPAWLLQRAGEGVQPA